ncbi:hypothetical protein NliqN6_2468 [Naganishia liquefaciens]|uniref:ATP synthase subunit delta, mitochondrial n=1 Tax=Naganishia liquefaciens TaxID=104408 RepID=A0A8H3YFU1_9TREE|nr:hypothetical protein NliqN6_2468 [Naganishia liquefaciens]
MFAALRPTASRVVARSALAGRRTYADVADGALKLSLVLPHQGIYNSSSVTQVNIPAATGDMGILANHVPTVEALRPGLLEIIETSGTKKYFVSAGFATVHGNNTLTINAVEAYEMDNFSPEAVRSGLAEAQRVLSSSASEQDKAEARVEVEVFEALQSALAK